MHKELSLKGHFHFIGVGGIGMSAIATALIKKGYSVSGSDLIKNNETERLKELGAIIFDAQIKNNIDFVNAKFQNHLKIDPEGFRYRFRVQNASRIPQVFISGHISCTRTLPADESKDEFLTKMAIFMNFNCDQMWPIFCRKALET